MATLSEVLQAYVDEVKVRIDAGNSTNEEISILVSGATDFPGTPAASTSFISEVTAYIQSASPLPEEMAILMATVNRTYLDGTHADILAGNKTPQEIAILLTEATLSVNTEVDALNQIYIDKFDALNAAGTLTPKELALMVSALSVLQNQIDSKKLMVGLATVMNNSIKELSNQAGPLLPFNPIGEIHFITSDYINYCINFYDEEYGRMYIATSAFNTANSLFLEFGYYSNDRIYTVLRDNALSGTNYGTMGAFILPLSKSSIDDTKEVCLIFYRTDVVVFLSENLPGVLNTYTANLATTYLVFDKVNKAFVFMPDSVSAVRMYSDGSTETVTDYTVTDAATFETAFWGNSDFLQLRGTDTPYWHWGGYTVTPTDMGVRTYDVLDLRYFSSGALYFQNRIGHVNTNAFQIPYTKMDLNGNIGYNTIQFIPETDIVNFDNQNFTYTKGIYCFVLDEDSNILSKFYINTPHFRNSSATEPAILYFNEPICFNEKEKTVVCRTALNDSLLSANDCHFSQLYY